MYVFGTVISLSIIILAIFITIRFLFNKYKRESLVINTPTSIHVLNNISDKLFEILNMKIDDELVAFLKDRDVYKEFTMEEGRKSFTENKHRMVLCIQERNGHYYNDNSLMFVALHELAHVINDEFHHTKKFYYIQDLLLERARLLGYYDPNISFQSNYCS